jgi:hypothetical protein
MMKKRKGQNSAVAKKQLVGSFEQALNQLDQSRQIRNRTPEENDQLIKADHIQDVRSNIQVGQRVWKPVIVEDFDTNKILNVCCKITSIDGDEVHAEMLYATDQANNQFEGYTDWDDVEHRKGDEFWFTLDRLEKHVAKTTSNIWWKVK